MHLFSPPINQPKINHSIRADSHGCGAGSSRTTTGCEFFSSQCRNVIPECHLSWFFGVRQSCQSRSGKRARGYTATGRRLRAGFPRTAPIIERTSDFVPHWQMVGWGGIQGGRFTSIVRAHKLHKETIVSVKGKKEQGWGKKSFQNQTNSRGN